MNPLRFRFTVRRLMVLVALISLNLAAINSTSRFYPRPKPQTRVMYGNGRGYVSYLVEGQVEYGEGNAETGYRRTRVELLPRRPTLLRIWSPVVASGGGSLLALGLSIAWTRAAEPRATRELSNKSSSQLMEAASR
jgi:hypothetical protein